MTQPWKQKQLAAFVVLGAAVALGIHYGFVATAQAADPAPAEPASAVTKGNAADIVSAHVLAMYIPSFFTGHLIARFGAYWTRGIAVDSTVPFDG